MALALGVSSAAWQDSAPATARVTDSEIVVGGTDPQDNELLLVMDASGSMTEIDDGGTVRIEAAREALHDVVDELDDGMDVGMRVFSADVTDPDDPGACTDSRLAQSIAGDNRDELRESIDRYDAVGARTPIAHALEAAAGDFNDEGHRTIVLVSDGEENCVPDPCEAARVLMENNIDVAIHTVGYNINDEAREQLQCIAETGHGEYFDAEDVDSLTWAMQRLSQRAFQPFMLEGHEVTGSPEIADAPMLSNGQYVDQWSDEPLFYRIPRTMEGSSIHVGISTIHDDEVDADPLAIALGPEDADSWETHRGRTYSTNRELCEQSNLYEGSGRASLLVRSTQVTQFPGNRITECDAADELILMVEAAADDNSYVGQSFEFVVEEEPPVTNLDELPPAVSGPVRDHPWEQMSIDPENAEELIGGNSFNDAVELEPGTTYTSEIHPGETLLYRVPVEWGEHLQAQMDIDPADEWRESPGRDRGFQLQLYSPYRGQIDHSHEADGQEHRSYGGTSHTSSSTWQNLTHPVRWNNREAIRSSGHTDMEYVSQAGDYYVMISQDTRAEEDPAIVPFQLAVETFGEVEGVPEYDTGAGAVEEADDVDEQAADEDESSGPGWMLLTLSVIGIALLALVVGVLVRVSRRSS